MTQGWPAPSQLFTTRNEILLDDPVRLRSSVEESNKNLLPLWGNWKVFRGEGRYTASPRNTLMQN